MKTLKQLITESVNEYLREIEEVGNNEAILKKMTSCEEAIAVRERKINMEGIEEAMHDMIDPKKIKELQKEVKVIEKTLKKYQKQLEKLKSKNKHVGAEDTEDSTEEPEEIIDENMEDILPDDLPLDMNNDDNNENLVNPEKKIPNESLNESFLYMQKLAGLITEGQYQAKKKALNRKKSIAEGVDEPFDALMDAVDDYYEPNTPEHKKSKLRNAVENALNNGDIDTMDFSDSPSSPYNTVARIAKKMEEENLVVTYIKNKDDYSEKGLADSFHEYEGKIVKHIVGYDENDEYDEIGYIYAKNNDIKDIKSYSDDELDNAFMSSLA